ncbi:MAG: hypothetical protein QOJ65_1784 [Fimbriimonadaceae bacterium]|jgi:hypothetical protein|nr:hypothetical protein [Fimbriimonadaceae bacterium]
MANRNPVRKTENLKPNRGQGVPNAGRKPSEFKRRREDVLNEIAAMKPAECPDYETIDQLAKEKLGALMAEGDGPTIRWYWDQQIGSPKTTVKNEVADEEIVRAVAKIAAKYLASEHVVPFVNDLIAELQGDHGPQP